VWNSIEVPLVLVLTYDPEIPLLGIHPKELKSGSFYFLSGNGV
jgi:hypothetical protein